MSSLILSTLVILCSANDPEIHNLLSKGIGKKKKKKSQEFQLLFLQDATELEEPEGREK